MKLLLIFVEVPQSGNCFRTNLDFIEEEKSLAWYDLLCSICFEFKKNAVNIKPTFKNPSYFRRFLKFISMNDSKDSARCRMAVVFPICLAPRSNRCFGFMKMDAGEIAAIKARV